MKKHYDFSKAKRGAVELMPPGKTRITIRLDNEIIDWFRNQVEAKGGGNYQTMINMALREYIIQEAVDVKLKRLFNEIMVPREQQIWKTEHFYNWIALSDNIRTDLIYSLEERWVATGDTASNCISVQL